jgi:trans-2,3-dihydro-3-hydroxyanthranilate isomerase
MSSYRFVTCDVFTNTRFGGNQLAVLPDARGLSDAQMLSIAREFNFSETTFVLPPADPAHTKFVRIFTPGGELTFAGHPTVGTAHALAFTGEIKLEGPETRIVLEEKVGPIPVVISARDGQPTHCQFAVAKLPEIVAPLPPRATLASVLSIDEDDILDGDWSSLVMSCGTPFALVPVRNRAVLAKSRINLDLHQKHLAGTPGDMVMVFALDPENPKHDVRARMYAPGINIAEDPATGSACAALGGYLAHRAPGDGPLRWIVEQGYEMGRPSLIELEADRSGGRITAVRVGGATVMVSEGNITVS